MKLPAFLSSLRRRFQRREQGVGTTRNSATRGRLFPRAEALERIRLLASNISGFVYQDANNNGVFDPGETPFANNRIQLLNSSGTVIGTTTTDANGFYLFTIDNSIPTAPQTITQTATINTTPTNFTLPLTPAINQFNPALGTLTSVDVVSNGRITSTTTARNLDTVNPQTFRVTTTGSLNVNGVGVTLTNPISLDTGPQTVGPGANVTSTFTSGGTTSTTVTNPASLASFIGTGTVIPGFTVTGAATSTELGDRNVNVTVANSGNETLTVVYRYIPANSLLPGNYTIVQPVEPTGTLNGRQSSNGTVLPPNNPATQGPDSIPVTLGATNSVNNNFGELLPASLSGFVYNDLNNNGLKEPGEAPFAGNQVILSGTNDLGPITPISQLTDTNGAYSFGNLRPGTYTVTEPTAPPGFVEGLKAINNVPIPGSNTTTSINGIAPPQGTTIPNNNFGEIACVPPTVTNLQRFGVHMQPTRIVLTFSEALKPATAQNLNNYRLVGPGADGRIGPNHFQTIPLRSATYDPATFTVTLVPVRELNVHIQYYLTVRGTPGGVTATCGSLLDGTNAGAPGSNYVHVVDRSILAGFNDYGGRFVAVNKGQIPPGVPGLSRSASAPYIPKPARGLSPTVVDQVLSTNVTAAKPRTPTSHAVRSVAAIDHVMATHSRLGRRHG